MIYGRVLSAFAVSLFVLSLLSAPSLCVANSPDCHSHSMKYEHSGSCPLKIGGSEHECAPVDGDMVLCCSHDGPKDSGASTTDVQLIAAAVRMPVYEHRVWALSTQSVAEPSVVYKELFRPPRLS